MKKALLVIDMQVDFCPGGALAVTGGDSIIPVINQIMPRFDLVVATQDWHPIGHISFASTHIGESPGSSIQTSYGEQILWPDHCVQGYRGSAFHPDLDTNPFSMILRKGTRKDLDSYSAFLENDRTTMTGLEGYLKNLRISTLYVCGLATDYCVYYTVMDALKLGFETKVIEDAVKEVGIPEGSLLNAVNNMKQGGAALLLSKDLE
ncbi:MAG: bifunctional nicotinamidase/pyrazinamidase [Spirochaetales bacterium]|nr:bifunctional nicotinamidase/pyrazinamidase [Spirochaetales bacterium]